MTIQQLIAKRLRLYARRKVITTLDGNYESAFRGKGVELDSLRPYVIGDNIKDIDWKATARTGQVHTRQYIPLRDQRIVVVADTSASMLLPSAQRMKKVDALYGVVVTLGMFVRKNRDLLAVCARKPNNTIAMSRFKNTNNHIESLLRELDQSVNTNNKENQVTMVDLLQHTLHSLKQRSAIFIVSDGINDPTEIKSLLLKLGIRHQLFFMQIEPTSPFKLSFDEDNQTVDIETGQKMPPELLQDPKLKKEWHDSQWAWRKLMEQACKSSGTAYGYIQKADDVPEVLHQMFILSRKYAKRH